MTDQVDLPNELIGVIADHLGMVDYLSLVASGVYDISGVEVAKRVREMELQLQVQYQHSYQHFNPPSIQFDIIDSCIGTHGRKLYAGYENEYVTSKRSVTKYCSDTPEVLFIKLTP
jgi:hypothetical protein